MTFPGFPRQALAWFASMLPGPAWPSVAARREEHQRFVRGPMEQLCADLADEFGPAHVWRLHRSPWMWSNQVATFAVADTIGFAITLCLDDLSVAGGWARSGADQVARYRAAVAGVPGARLAELVGALRERGYAIEGDRLARPPREAPADPARAELARHRTLVAARAWPAGRWLHTPAVLPRVRAVCRELAGLVDWLDEHVGPRRR